MGTVVDTVVVPDVGAMMFVPHMVIAVSIMVRSVDTLVVLVLDPVVVMLTDVGVTNGVSGMVIAVKTSMISVDLVMVTVVDTVVPDVGAMMFVPHMVIAVWIMMSYVMSQHKTNKKNEYHFYIMNIVDTYYFSIIKK